MKIKPEQFKTWAKIAMKLGVASTLATLLVQWLDLGFAFPAAIVPVLVTGQTRGSTVQASFNRIKGTFVGTAVGAVVHELLGNSAIALLIAVSVTVFICHWVGLAGVKGSAGYIAAITLILNSNQQPWLLAGSQFVALSIGIVITNLIDDWLWAPKVNQTLYRESSQMLHDLATLYQLAFESYTSKVYRGRAIIDADARIVAAVRRSEQFWQEAITQQYDLVWSASAWKSLLVGTWNHIRAMDQAAQSTTTDETFWQPIEPELTALATATVAGLHQLADAVSNRSKLPIQIDQPLQAAIQALEPLQITNRASSSELHRFFSFFYSMEEVAQNLQQMSVEVKDLPVL
jgi:uncharacterized membrane protein YccC